MIQEQLSYRSRILINPLTAGKRRIGLRWKVIASSAGGVVLFGLLAFAIVNYQMGRVLRTQLDQRALDIATNLGDAAAAHMLRGNVLELNALVTKYSLLNGVAYAVISDAKGQIAAHSGGAFPQELRESLTAHGQREVNRREFALRGRKVSEIRAPILDGQVGTVYVGMWSDIVGEATRHALLPLLGLVAIALVASVISAILVTRWITRPVLRLKEIADRVTMGDLETPVGIASNDELGDLALSLERMRSSLKAAMVRLERAS